MLIISKFRILEPSSFFMCFPFVILSGYCQRALHRDGARPVHMHKFELVSEINKCPGKTSIF